MDLYAFPPIAAVLDAAYAVLMGLAALLEPLIGVTSAAAAIVLITLLVRAVLIPTAVSMAKGEQARARLAPKMQALQRKHKDNPERLQRELMKLYADEGTSPLAGCLPMLVQAPVVGVIYALFILPTVNGHENALLSETFGGVPLGSSFAGELVHGTLTWPTTAVFLVLVLVIAAVAEVTRRVFKPAAPVTPAGGTGTAGTGSAPAGPAAMPNVAHALGFLQYLTAVIALFVPLAAGLYLATTVIWTLGQRMLLRRRYPLPVPPAAPA